MHFLYFLDVINQVEGRSVDISEMQLFYCQHLLSGVGRTCSSSHV